MNSYFQRHPWLNRAIYASLLLLWIAFFTPSLLEGSWTSPPFVVRYVVIFTVPALLLLAHAVFLSFWSWLAVLVAYSFACINRAIQGIQEVGAVLAARGDASTVWISVILILIMYGLPFLLFIATKPPRHFPGRGVA
jgi:hypothetical protein